MDFNAVYHQTSISSTAYQPLIIVIVIIRCKLVDSTETGIEQMNEVDTKNKELVAFLFRKYHFLTIDSYHCHLNFIIANFLKQSSSST